jgi:DNA-binding MarR family transcriptional regulator
MSPALRLRSPEACPEESLFVEIARTADLLARNAASLLKTEDLSSAQYNVLRILRGTPQGLLCGEIASRMISRAPDITRLVDRMDKRGLISRYRRDQDRRGVLVRIAPEGLALLARLDEPVRRVHREQLGHLRSAQIHQIRRLLCLCRKETV